MLKLPEIFYSIQRYLFPDLEEDLGELREKHKEFIRIIELVDLERYASTFSWKGIGCKPHDRTCIIKALIAKPVFKISQTRGLVHYLRSAPSLRRLCGWEMASHVPSEWTFSRAITAFAETDLGDKIHEAMIKEHHADKIVGHANKDSTAVTGREKACRKNTYGEKRNKKRGRPAKDTVVEKEPRRLQENISDLPVNSDRVASLYDVMDSAYDAPEIHNFSRKLNHVPVIDNNPRRGEKVEFEPAKAVRYNERTAVERANSELKDSYGLENIFVKGYKKVKLHIMFAVIALTAKTLFNMLI